MPIVEVHCRTAAFENGEPLNDVFVSVHPEGGGNALASGTTGAGLNQSGSVSLGNLAAGKYEVHITPALPATLQGGSLQEIEVSGVQINVFDVLVDVSGLEPASDSHFCRCSGTFKDPYGKPVPNMKIHFSEGSLPQLLHYAGENITHGVIPKSIVVSTDSSGFASVDLLRGFTYSIYMEGYENLTRVVEVPDLAAAPLPDVIFPIIASVEYTHPQSGLLNTGTPAVSMSVGDVLTLSIETVHRSGVRVEGLVSTTLDLTEGSEDLVDFEHSGGDLVITAKSPGVASFTLTRNSPEDGKGISALPAIQILGELSVTVIPE